MAFFNFSCCKAKEENILSMMLSAKLQDSLEMHVIHFSSLLCVQWVIFPKGKRNIPMRFIQASATEVSNEKTAVRGSFGGLLGPSWYRDRDCAMEY